MFGNDINLTLGLGGTGFGMGLNSIPIYGSLDKTTFEQSVRLNISRKVNSMALTRFKWEGLPDTIKASQIEKFLYFNGLAVVFYDSELKGITVLPATFVGTKLDNYGDPIEIEGLKANGESVKLINKENCILLGNDPYYTGDFTSLQGFTDQIVKLENSRRNNGRRLTSIPIFQTDSENVQGAQINVLQSAIDNNEFGLMSATRVRQTKTGQQHSSVNADFEILDFTESYHGAELDNEISLNWDRIADTLGINTAHRSTDSGISDEEINKNSDIGHASGIAAFEFRNEKAEEINKMFGTNIKVNWFDNNKQQEIEGGDTDEIQRTEN